jgi:hypothetical protein
VAGTLLKAIAGAVFLGEDWHPITTKYTNSTDNVAVRATMSGQGTIEGLSFEFG